MIANLENDLAIARSRERACRPVREARTVRSDRPGGDPAARNGARGSRQPVALRNAPRPPQGDRAGAGHRPGGRPVDLARRYRTRPARLRRSCSRWSASPGRWYSARSWHCFWSSSTTPCAPNGRSRSCSGCPRWGWCPRSPTPKAASPAARPHADRPQSPYAEAVRPRSTQVCLTGVGRPPPTLILVTSALPGEGKTARREPRRVRCPARPQDAARRPRLPPPRRGPSFKAEPEADDPCRARRHGAVRGRGRARRGQRGGPVGGR